MTDWICPKWTDESMNFMNFMNRYSFSHNHGLVENGYIWKVTILLEGPIFDFHDYGRKCKGE